MPSTTLLQKLQFKYQDIQFLEDDDFFWSHSENAIHYNTCTTNWKYLLFHEVGHAQLDHSDYNHDLDLIVIERSAWDLGASIAQEYDIMIPETIIQEHLDSYRDWQHQRSICPNCQSTGTQRGRYYFCLACSTKWSNNNSMFKQLKRKCIK
jgi:hypothetical protein